MDMKSALENFKRETANLVAQNKALQSELLQQRQQIELDREAIVKDRADLIKKNNALLSQSDALRIEYEHNKQTGIETAKLSTTAHERIEQAKALYSLAEAKEKDVSAREIKLVDLDNKIEKLSGLEALKSELAIKEEMLKREQDLLYEKQKTLEVREGKISQGEERLKRLHADI